MKKIWLTLFIFINLTTIVYATKTDIYFGNGILTIERDAMENSYLLSDAIEENIYNGDKALFDKDINQISYAYNQTKGFFYDVIESGLQKLLPESPGAMRVWAGSLMNATAQTDLNEQLQAYRQSHSKGNKILIVAHSQGNLFANRVNTALFNPEYLHIVHIAAPTDAFTSEDVVGWDNDLVAWGGFWHDDLTDNTVRSVVWDKKPITLGGTDFKPESDYVLNTQIEPFYDDVYSLREPYLLGSLDSLVHAFTFYMGRPLKEDLLNNTSILPLALQKPTAFKNIPNAIDSTNLTNTDARDMILGYIEAQLDINSLIDNGGTVDTNTSTPDTNTTTGGGTGGANFDFTTSCSITDLPDPMPSELTTSINTLIENAGSGIVADVVCPLIQTAVTAYNLSNGGGLPDGIGFD